MKKMMTRLSVMTLVLISQLAGAATIGALVDGQVMAIAVKEGDKVSKGQLLLEVDARAQQGRIAQLKSKLRLAELELKDAKLDFEAEKALFDQSATAKRRYDAAVLVNDRALAKVDVLRNELSEATAKLDYYLIKAPFDATISKLWIQNGDTVFHENQKLLELEAK
jgi:RND family efflux transporter MFP subunit